MSINNNTIKRIASDVKYILNNDRSLSLENIYYKHDEENILKGYALIIGQKNTPYAYGYYFFEFNFPDNYPFSPPVVRYLTNDGITRFNPNLYTNGKVCLSVLNTWSGESWTACQTISSILLTLSSILCDNPLLNEPGVQENNNDAINKYNYLITYKNVEFSICKIINYMQNYDISTSASTSKDDIIIMYKFKNIIYETFINNKTNIIEYLSINKIKYAEFIDVCEEDKIIIQKKKKFVIPMYNLTFYLEYNKLHTLVLNIKID